MATRNGQYTDQEMSVATLAGLGVNYLAILDVTGRQIFSRSTDLAGKTEVAAPLGVGRYLRPSGRC